MDNHINQTDIYQYSIWALNFYIRYHNRVLSNLLVLQTEISELITSASYAFLCDEIM